MAAGALLGLLGLRTIAGELVTPWPVDPRRWRVISPGLDEDIHAVQAGRGTHVTRGALTMTEHVFFRPDIVVAQTARPIHAAELVIAEDSGPVWVSFGERPAVVVILHPTAVHPPAPGSGWLPSSTRRYIVSHEGGHFWLDLGGERLDLGAGTPGTMELSCVGEPARVERVRLLDSSGALLLEEHFDTWLPPASATVWATGSGAVLGLAAGALATSAAGALSAGLLSLPLLLSLAVAPETWLALVERLYLSNISPWELARGSALIAALPLLGAALVRGTPLAADDHTHARDPQVRALWWGGALIAAAIATARAPSLWVIPGVLILGLAPWTGRRAKLPAAGWLGRDLPALAMVALGGWGLGLAAAIAWRLLVLTASASGLLQRAPRPAADHLSLLLLAIPLTIEGSLQHADLPWAPHQLSPELPSERGWREVVAAWKGSCDETEGEGETEGNEGENEEGGSSRIAFLGGSSTGGAYQFSSEPGAFFAAQAHLVLCEGRDGFTTTNFGTGDGNTFTISRTIEQVFEQAQPDLLVLYVGVNDLLTQHHTMTRKEREDALSERGTAASGLAGLGRRSRVVTGLSLLLRADAGHSENVSAVPIADAEENLHRIAEAARDAGARVLLMTELITPSMAAAMVGYDPMMRSVAEAHDHVRWENPAKLLGITRTDEVLVDRNHLSREGNRRMGEVLAPIVMEMLER